MDTEKSIQSVEVAHVFTQEEVTFDYYSCEEAISRLNDYLDHELSPAERQVVLKHLDICEPCLERFNFEQNLITSLKAKMKEMCCPNALKNKLSALVKGASKQ